MQHIWAMILAAGQGSRLISATAGLPKQFLEWHKAPLYWASVKTFAQCARIRGLLLVFPQDYLTSERQRLLDLGIGDIGLPWRISAGGVRRQDSVRLGLNVLQQTDCDAVLIHDSARPFATLKLINSIIDALEFAKGAVPALSVTDTIKEIDPDSQTVTKTLDRSRLVSVQTPQGFWLDTLIAAHAKAEQENVTDDACLLEQCGENIQLVPGELKNRKITTPEDLLMLQTSSAIPCTGWGYDVHRFALQKNESSRPLKLGGVALPKAPDILAHSDGDVLLHALMDAILGTCDGGDIGQRFPDSNPAFSGIDSAVLLDDVLRLAQNSGVSITHVDLTIIAQIPKINPYREEIRRNISRLLSLDPCFVNVKATTEEGLGFTGEKLGIKAVAIVDALRTN